MITVTINGEKREFPKGITFETIAKEYQKQFDAPIFIAIENGKIRELAKTVKKENAEISFLTMRDKIGHSTYVRSASLLLVKAVSDVIGDIKKGKIKIEFSIGQGYYCSVRGDFSVTEEFIEKVRVRMQELVDADLPITKQAYNIDSARELFAGQGMEDKEELFWYRRSSYVNVYCLDGYYDYNYGYMVPSTGYVQLFEIQAYREGIMLILPTQENPNELLPFVPREKLFETLMESKKWTEDIGVVTVGDLNKAICEQRLQDVVLMQEALQERKIAEIASEIAKRGNVKFVMIAGPSSSGKTTLSHRLSTQLRTHGLKPHPIAVGDDGGSITNERKL